MEEDEEGGGVESGPEERPTSLTSYVSSSSSRNESRYFYCVFFFFFPSITHDRNLSQITSRPNLFSLHAISSVVERRVPSVRASPAPLRKG